MYEEGQKRTPVGVAVQLRQFALPCLRDWLFEQPLPQC